MARPTWQGHLRLSLVTCPVALYKATEARTGVSFNMIDPVTKDRVRQQLVNSRGDVVDRSTMLKGYEVEKGQYVIVDKEDLEALKLEGTQIIDIEEFVETSSIDRLYWDEPYYLAPASKTALEAFSVIQEAMRQSKKLALGRLVMSQRERICAIEPRGDVMVLTTLRAHDEVRSIDENVPVLPLPKPSKEMLAIASKIVEQQAGTFNPEKFNDRYEDAVRDLIARKQKGQRIVASRPIAVASNDNADDLMAALKASIAGGSRTSRRRSSEADAGKPPARRAKPDPRVERKRAS